MSAFIVSDLTIFNIVRFLDLDVRFPNASGCYGVFNRILLEHGFNFQFNEHKDRLVKEMAKLNYDGVNARYEKCDFEHKIKYIDDLPPSLIQAYKSLGCFLYQCTEGDIPETSGLYKMFQEIKNEMAHSIVHRLEDYDQAVWDY